MSERQAILNCLKTRGEVTAIEASNETGLTSMGARGHLERLEKAELVSYREIKEGRGRPKRFWYLTELGHRQFPQQYDHLSIELIENVRQVFGQDGLDQLIEVRESKALEKYATAIQNSTDSPEGALTTLASERTKEGYMAEVITTDGGWQLIEHHCPICAAAEKCQGFCESELAIFKQSLGSEFEVTRSEHLLNNGERCRYDIRLKGEK